MSHSTQCRLFISVPICLSLHYLARQLDPHVQYAFAHSAFMLISVLAAWQLTRIVIRLFQTKIDTTNDKIVLITGCDSGFGLNLAIQLYASGFHVVAGCLSLETDGARQLLQLSSNSLHNDDRNSTNVTNRLDVVKMNVTDTGSIESTFTHVQKLIQQSANRTKLWALIHNAGIGHYSATYWDQSGIRRVFEDSFNVNTFAIVNVTNAFLPLLTQNAAGGSRILLMGSYAGRFTFSAMSSYCATKHCVRVLANSMRRELRPFNVQVVHIEPSMYSTGITNQQSCLANLNLHWKRTRFDHFGAEFRQQAQTEYDQICTQVQSFMNTTSRDVQQVLDTIENAIRYRHPLPFYRVSNFIGRLFMYALEWMPEELHDILLEGQLYTKLVKVLQVRKN